MPAITIRNVPPETRDELAERAARSGRSLQEYLRSHLIEFADHPDKAAVLERIQQRLDRDGTTLSTAEILAERDADRR